MRAENYLSLVGFIMVVLGGIGVWSVTRVFVKQKIRSVAILKCVGATASQILATYVAQVVLLGTRPAACWASALRPIAIAAIPASAAAAFGNVSYGLTASAALQGLAVGLLVSLLFSLVPLLEVRRVKPLLLLRALDTVSAAADARARGSWRAAMVPAWVRRADPVQIGAGVSRHGRAGRGGRLAGVVHPGRAGRLRRLCRRSRWCCTAPARCWCAPPGRSPPRPYFPLRHAVVSLRRPGNQTRVILLAVGLGSFFVLGVRALQSNLLDAVLRAAAARRCGHVPDRHPAGSGRRRACALPRRRRSASRG